MNTQRLRESTLTLGTWISIGSSIVSELAALSGFDWLLFDLEHGNGSEAVLLPQLQSLRGSRAAGIVRVGAPHPDLISRVLDWGADGIMVPHVESVLGAEACVEALHYPPRGTRGVSRSVRAFAYGLRPFAPEKPFLFAQIETLQAVGQAAGIAAVEGVDALFVGPADLQYDLARHDMAKGSYQECLARVVEAAHGAGKVAGILVRTSAEVASHTALGFSHIAVDSDLSILRQAYQRILADARGLEA